MQTLLRATFLLMLLPVHLAFAADNPELRAIKDADQADRSGLGMGKDWRAVVARDKSRRDRVLEILKDGGLDTAWDHFNAALVLQHGGSADDIRLAHALSTLSATLDPAHPGARWLMAASWDRLMLRLEQPQWYGTQWVQDAAGTHVLSPVQPGAVTDADRIALGVPTLAEMQARLDALNSGKQMPRDSAPTKK